MFDAVLPALKSLLAMALDNPVALIKKVWDLAGLLALFLVFAAVAYATLRGAVRLAMLIAKWG